MPAWPVARGMPRAWLMANACSAPSRHEPPGVTDLQASPTICTAARPTLDQTAVALRHGAACWRQRSDRPLKVADAQVLDGIQWTRKFETHTITV